MRSVRLTLHALFFASGASALILQSVWQRVLSLHAGMDLFSVTTVVAAFMAGLGLGNLVGGWLADRLGPARAVLVYAAAELLIGAFAWVSIWLLYHQYALLSSHLSSTAAAFLAQFALLLVPTFGMGLTLPLLSRGLVRAQSEIAPLVGRLYGINTFGAAVGSAAASGFWLLGTLGLQTSVRVAATLNLGAGLLSLTLLRAARKLSAPTSDDAPDASRSARHRAWTVIYGLTGFVSLSLEIVWFRVLNVLMTSNTYTFSRLLTLYLVGLGTGALVGSHLAARTDAPERTFVRLQLSVALAALVGPLLLVGWLRIAGFPSALGFRNALAPAFLLLPPTFLMGLSFPVVQRLVATRVDTIGRRTGGLLFANTLGCVLGTVVAGFVLLDRLGTPATLRILGIALVLVALAAAVLFRAKSGWLGTAVLAVTGIAAAAALPNGAGFWAPLHGAHEERFALEEDGSCVTALAHRPPDEYMLQIGGEPQNGYPFDGFHVRLGVVPMLAHADPGDVLVVGLGIGSTPFGVSLDPRAKRVACVEICAGEQRLLEGLRQKGLPELHRLFTDRRIELSVRDGRKFLLDEPDQYDVVITDTLRPRSAYSGSLYSAEFYELVKRRLKPNGLFAQWVPTERTLRTAAHVFPHVQVLESDALGEGESLFFLASNEPIRLDREELLRRFESMAQSELRPEMREHIVAFLAGLRPVAPPPSSAVADLNRDLFPRDEYGNW